MKWDSRLSGPFFFVQGPGVTPRSEILLPRQGGGGGSNIYTSAHWHISRGQQVLRQLGGFLAVVIIVALFVPTVCPVGGGGGYVGYMWKALEEGYLEHPGLHAVVTTCLGF